MMNFDEMLSKPVFNNLEPEKKEAFKQLLVKLDGKSSIESVGIIMEFSKNMPKGKPLSKEEQSVMISAALETMDERERKKFLPILKMMGFKEHDNLG